MEQDDVKENLNINVKKRRACISDEDDEVIQSKPSSKKIKMQDGTSANVNIVKSAQ